MTETSPPNCAHCGGETRHTRGEEIYPHRPDLAFLHFYRCDSCDAHVGCHGETKRPLGNPANKELRRLRNDVHRVLDPIWENALDIYPGGKDERGRKIIRHAARARTYAFLADRLGISKKKCHTAMFDAETCRAAIEILTGLTYRRVRAWAKAQKLKKEIEDAR